MKKRVLKVVVLIAITLTLFTTAFIKGNPSVQIMISVLNFSEKIMTDPGYLCYGIDLMDLFTNYMNADVTYEGEAYLKKMDKFKFSTSGSISGVRAFSQGKLSMNTDMAVLWKDLGGISMYAEGETVYLVVPMLDNLSYAFDTGVDLFKKGPSFTRDFTQEWIHENAYNIIDFLNHIEIDKTGNTYFDEETGITSYEYKMTIPQGQGKFIYDLLGMDMPKNDVVASIYLDKHYHTKRIEFDLSRSLEGAKLVVCGDSMGTLIFTIDLPDNESSTMTIVRDGNTTFTNNYSCQIDYYANSGHTYTITNNMNMDYIENGMSGKLSNIVVTDNGKVIAEATCEGQIQKIAPKKDVFANAEVDLTEIEHIDWKELRDDTETFINDLIAKAKENLLH